MRITIPKLLERLDSYPGAHPGETWKLDKDLTRCTDREKEAIKALGYEIADFERAGLDRGQMHHILYGYRFSK